MNSAQGIQPFFVYFPQYLCSVLEFSDTCNSITRHR